VGAARTHPRRQPGRWLAAAAASLALSALVAAPAQAVNGVIDGSPLNVYANDLGRLQVAFDGSTTGEFYPGTLTPGDGGFSAAVQPIGAAAPPPFTVYGLRGGLLFTPTASAPPTVSGAGSPASPFLLTTQYEARNAQGVELLHVTQTLSYVNGTTDVTATYTVRNPSTAGLMSVRLYESADILPAGGYAAAGFLELGPPRRVGGQGLYRGLGGSDSLVEVTPWSHFQEAYSATVANVVSNTNVSATGFNDTVAAAVETRGAGVGAQWDLGALGAGASQTRSVIWRFNRTNPLDLGLATQTKTTGQTATVTVTARSNDGAPDAGRGVRYTIAGANPGAGAVTTAGDGTAAITWMGAKVGTDTLTAFVDRDGNGVWDVNTEPRQIVTVTWAPLPPPVPGKSVNVQVVSGQVMVKLPGGRRARATGPAKGFVPLAGPLQIPVGSQLDTTKGRVALTSAAATKGTKTQESDFYDGIFQVKQSLPKKKSKKAVALTTDLVLKGQIPPSQCAPLKGARAAAATKKKKGPKSSLGKLWGNGKGKFRTTGKYSAATVRGTKWLTQDRCDGTLTKVVRGTVSVRDFKRNKTVTVKAGHSYLARAQRAASKSRKK
jgi:hypothetical protein